MPSRRAASPAASEPELDILDSLYPGEGENGGQNFGADGLDFDGFLNAGAGGDGEDDDEAFIALQQAASYRKASNLKGRTVKKGGGFQAMGKRKAVDSLTKRISLTDSSTAQVSMRISSKPSPARVSQCRRRSRGKRSPSYSKDEMSSAWPEPVQERRLPLSSP